MKNDFDLRADDYIKPAMRLAPPTARNITNDFVNAMIILFIICAVFFAL